MLQVKLKVIASGLYASVGDDNVFNTIHEAVRSVVAKETIESSAVAVNAVVKSAHSLMSIVKKKRSGLSAHSPVSSKHGACVCVCVRPRPARCANVLFDFLYLSLPVHLSPYVCLTLDAAPVSAFDVEAPPSPARSPPPAARPAAVDPDADVTVTDL